MPREIADSDAESDLDSPHRPSASPIPENIVEAPPLSTLEQDPFANLEFDQFLSPTQRLSSAVERQDVSQPQSISSTDRFLQDMIQTEEAAFNSTATSHGFDGANERSSSVMPRSSSKRTLSDIEGGRPKSHADEETRKGSAKRAKTYGNSMVSKSDTEPLFSDGAGTFYHREQDDTKTKARPHSESTSTSIPVQQLVNPDSPAIPGRLQEHLAAGYEQSYHRQGATSFAQGNIQNTSITKSSMSGYTGINMDFRGAGLGLETSANPFGSLSQVSLDGDVDPIQTEKFASLFQHSQQTADNPVPISDALDTLAPNHLDEMATSSIEASRESRQNGLSGRNLDTSATEDSETLLRTEANSEARTANIEEPEHKNTTRKKRGRKPKSLHTHVNDAASEDNDPHQLQSEDPLDLPPEQYNPGLSRSRAGTVDSLVSHTSQISGATEKSSRKRKRTNADKVEASNGKHLSSELNLSDPAMIGAPKEMYVPRPSKSRSKRVVQDEDELQQDEQSRRDGQNTPVPPQDSNESADVTQSTNAKKKTGKKSKVKRAKTSAAALLKSAEMYDEDDMDCIIVDEIPAKVKMAPLPEIGRVKPEPQVDERNERQEEPPTDVKITIDVPKLVEPDNAEPVEPASKPKKRGRKPKSKAEIHTEPIEVVEKAEFSKKIDGEKPEDGRSPLSEKDPNTATASKSPPTDHAKPVRLSATPPLEPDPDSKPQSQTSSPKKPVHSPLKPRPKLTSTASTPTPASSVASSSFWTKPRVGLSRRTTIPSLLRKLDRSKEPPKLVERKEKLSKRQQEEEDRRRLEAEDAGEVYVERWAVRGKDGMLVEWDE